MTAMNGQALPPAAAAAGAGGKGATRAAALDTPRRLVDAATLVAGLGGVALGFATVVSNPAASVAAPVLLIVGAVVALSLARDRLAGRRVDRGAVAIVTLAWAGAALLVALPEYVFGWEINGVIHRSVAAAPLLLVVGTLATSRAIRRLNGDTPTAGDLAVYPILVVPVGLVLLAYGLLLGFIVAQGASALSIDVLTTAWGERLVGEPGAGGEFVYELGLRNHIAGTLLLVMLTCLVALLPGIAVGVYVAEYPGRLAGLIGFATTMLRAMSVFIIGVALLAVVELTVGMAPDSPVSRLIRGSFSLTEGGVVQPGSGSFVTAAVFLALLVIPTIAKLTEQGLRSVPREVREGSIAMGATEGYGLRRILVPWAAPNIVTGLLLGAAEAAGSLAIIMFVAGNGEHGVGPLSSVTSLDYALFSTRYGTQPFIQTMGYRAETDYAYTAALLLLLLTLGLTIGAMLVRRHFASRYRGSLVVV